MAIGCELEESSDAASFGVCDGHCEGELALLAEDAGADAAGEPFPPGTDPCIGKNHQPTTPASTTTAAASAIHDLDVFARRGGSARCASLGANASGGPVKTRGAAVRGSGSRRKLPKSVSVSPSG